MVTSVSSTNVTGGALTGKATGASDVDFTTFLKLLTTQLQYQDPLNPLEGTEFTAQLAQFSSLEQQVNSNKNLEALVEQADYSAQAVAVSYIGKETLATNNKLTLTEDGQGHNFAYQLDTTSAQVLLEIYSSTGEKIRTIVPEGHKQGVHQVTWDGMDDSGDAAAAGNYNVVLSAVNSDGDKTAGRVMTFSTVAAVDNADGSLKLITKDGSTIDFSSVLLIREPVTQEQS